MCWMLAGGMRAKISDPSIRGTQPVVSSALSPRSLWTARDCTQMSKVLTNEMSTLRSFTGLFARPWMRSERNRLMANRAPSSPAVMVSTTRSLSRSSKTPSHR